MFFLSLAIAQVLGAGTGALLNALVNIYAARYAEQRPRRTGGGAAHYLRPVSVPLLLSSMAAFVVVAWQVEGVAAVLAIWWASALLLLLAWVDARTLVLPGPVCHALVWSGLLINSRELLVTVEHALWGAAGGYLFLWAPAQLYRIASRREGMGGGDFILCAGLGAWLGVGALPSLVLLASMSGILYGLGRQVIARVDWRRELAFGPHLALAGWLLMLWGDTLGIHALATLLDRH